MRSHLLLLPLSLSLLTPAKGQDYVPFPERNAFWSAMHCEPGPMVPKSGLVKVGVFGDTVIQGKTYHKLYLGRKYVNFRFSCDTCGFAFDLSQAFYFMSYREENKVVWFVPEQNGFGDPPGTEYPVFDFNLDRPGQTYRAYEYVFAPYGSSTDPTPMLGCGAMQDTTRITVASIDSVMMSDGSCRRRINFEPLTYGLRESWIEGMGSTKGFGFSLNVTNSYNTMICFSHDGISLGTSEILSQQLCTSYPDISLTFPDRCEYTAPASVPDIPADVSLSVFPNPFSDEITFSGLAPDARITVYDLLGQVRFNEVSHSETMVLTLPHLAKGLYLYTIASPGCKLLRGKMVKTGDT